MTFTHALSPPPPRHWPLMLLGVFLLALCVLTPGIQSPTGLTGKDEFALGLRTPLEMMERDAWTVPVLNGQPRLKKPPLLYWLGRASFETFGPSLPAARGIAVVFAALMVAATAAIGRRCLGSPAAGLWAAALLLSMLGISSESRRFMLDIPTAALSTLAFLFFLRWREKDSWPAIGLGALCLAAGFLIKGPIVALVCGGGILALLLAGQLGLPELWRRKLPLLSAGSLFLALALPWFIYVRLRFPEAAAAELQEELEARQFFSLSPDSLLGLIQIGLPWSLAVLALTPRAWREGGTPRFLLLWLLATFVPFLFIHTFDRYLVGSLVPLALLGAWGLQQRPGLAPWGLRLGALLMALFVAVFAVLAFWFRLGGWGWVLPPLLWLLWAGLHGRQPAEMAVAALVTWVAFFALLFPQLGINAVPPEIRQLAQDRPVLMFDGPQPAMLPILLGRPLTHSSALSAAHLAPQNLLVFAREEDVQSLQEQVAKLGHKLKPLGEYRVLSSRGSGIRFAREGSGKAEWQAALQGHSLEPLLSRIRYFEVQP